uniref:Uncharacterized protein n=1 Tax=Pyxicephalus adspersus TaxID=30357 RepID=A0AAV2ZYF7_PYXAD|nr:TPA: hypothetical protein GDO54_002533 [Pyxicephalus adspersus]
MELSTVLLLSFAILALVWRKFSRPKGFPPGPPAMPILGNILQMDFANPLQDLKRFSKQYGQVYSIYLGFTPAVVIQGFKDLKEVLVNKGVDFADRPQNRLIETISGTRGLVAAHYGRAWKEHRRFTLSTLRNFGLGKKSMEERIHEESVYLIKELRKNQDTLVDPHFVLDNAVSNIICSIVFGRRYDYDDTTFRDILNVVHENMKMATGFWAQLYNAFGFVKHLPLPHQKIFKNVKTVFGFLGKVLEEHKRTRVPGEPRDYIDCYLDELDTGTLIITDLSSVHYDEKYWKYPNEFNPENFLNKDGELIKVEAFLPFSAGPRVCLGENLARMEIFLFFTTMMTHFEFHWPDPKSSPDITPVFGLSQAPKRFKMRLVPRI